MNQTDSSNMKPSTLQLTNKHHQTKNDDKSLLALDDRMKQKRRMEKMSKVFNTYSQEQPPELMPTSKNYLQASTTELIIKDTTGLFSTQDLSEIRQEGRDETMEFFEYLEQISYHGEDKQEYTMTSDSDVEDGE